MKQHKLIKLIIIVFIIFCIGLLIKNYSNNPNLVLEVNYENKILNDLTKLTKKEEKINLILDDYEEYPFSLLYTLSKDLDLLDYVLGYKENKGLVLSEEITDDLNEVPLFLQWDQRWGYGYYGDNVLAINGCGPTSLAMVLTYLTKDKTLTPYKIAKMAEEKHYYVPNSGTTWNLMHYGGMEYGVESKVLGLSKTSVFNALENNHPIICNVGPGDFTLSGHYIVLTDVIDGKLKINDPNSIKRSNQLWDFDSIKSQIKNLWEFYLV